MILKGIVSLCLIYKTYVASTEIWPVNITDISEIVNKTPFQLTKQNMQRIKPDIMQVPQSGEVVPKEQRIDRELTVQPKVNDKLRNLREHNTYKSKQKAIFKKRADDKRKLKLNKLLTMLSNTSLVNSIRQKRKKPKNDALRTDDIIEQTITTRAKSERILMDKSEIVNPVNVRSVKIKPVDDKEIEKAKDVAKVVKEIREVQKQPLHLKEWANFEATGKSRKPVGRAGGMRPLPHADILDMAAAKGNRLSSMRVKGRLCHRHVLFPEGPKYDSHGRAYMGAHDPERHGIETPFERTRRPRVLLPSCCNCCKKSVLGCE